MLSGVLSSPGAAMMLWCINIKISFHIFPAPCFADCSYLYPDRSDTLDTDTEIGLEHSLCRYEFYIGKSDNKTTILKLD